jgi:GWxTD domain-containing protein
LTRFKHAGKWVRRLGQAACCAGSLILLSSSSQANISVTASYATYRLAPDHDSCLTEYYYGVSRDGLHFNRIEIDSVRHDSVLQAAFKLELRLTDTLGTVVDSWYKMVGTRVPSWEDAGKRDVKVIDVLPLYLRAGVYYADLTITDLSGEDTGRRVDTLFIADKNRAGVLTMSDLQFAYRIDPVDESGGQGPKIKGGYYVEPNPADIFAPEDSLLFLYGEVYNLREQHATYHVQLWILDNTGQIEKDLGPELLNRPGESALLVYGLRIDDLARGQWHTVALEVEHGLQTVTSRRSFWLGTGVDSIVDRRDRPFTDEDALANRRFIVYLATPIDLQEYDALTLPAKQRFLDEFWRRRDTSPETLRNEAFDAYRLRYEIANQRFSRSMMEQKDGWNTDRGRILIVYGEPDEVIINPSSVGTWGWERWEYEKLEGGSFFIFLDWKNLGDYRLMHSNKQGERYDPDWQRKIELEGIDIRSR